MDMRGLYSQLIVDTTKLEAFAPKNRKWQGIPGIAITKNGRFFVSFYSGKETEDLGNYCVLMQSNDYGKTWIDPVAVIFVGEESRAYDPCVWVDNKNRLWFFASITPEQKVIAYVCEDPDADELVWTEEKTIGEEVMLNKPTVLKSGKWLMPLAVWAKGVMQPSKELRGVYEELDKRDIERKAFCVVSCDEGKTFEKQGGIVVDEKVRSYEEHLFIEKDSGELVAYLRTKNGTVTSSSLDGGKNWSNVKHCDVFAPNTRIFVRRLSSGNMLMVAHRQSEQSGEEMARKNLIAYISKDEGKTWEGGLLLDERMAVSYPDGQEHNGVLYIVYDRERRTQGEILLATFTEQDVINGSITDKKSRLKQVVTKLIS